jgi:4-hydroxy-4-methyl-2-oxoglutarate aldolase
VIDSFPPDFAARLAACGVASVYEALGRRFALSATIRPLWSCAAIAGRAFTVRGVASDNLALHRAVADAPSGVVIAAEIADGDAAVWGSLLSAICLDKGILALVTNGRVRDTDRIRQLGFPVFCAGVTVTGPTKQDRGELLTTISISDVAIAPGDWIVGDGDGVVVVPADIADGALAAAEAIETREAEIISRARDGETTIAQLGLQSLVDGGS